MLLVSHRFDWIDLPKQPLGLLVARAQAKTQNERLLCMQLQAVVFRMARAAFIQVPCFSVLLVGDNTLYRPWCDLHAQGPFRVHMVSLANFKDFISLVSSFFSDFVSECQVLRRQLTLQL